MARVLLIDASPLIYSVFDTQGHLSTKEGTPTGLRYGFIRSIRSYQNRTKADKVGICFDLPGQVKKAEGRPEYKKNREMTDKKREMYAQVPDLRRMLRLTKWAQVDAEGYEADDCVATLARKFEGQGHEINFVSTDNDLLQLVNPNCTRFNPKAKKKAEMYTGPIQVREETGVLPQHFLAYKALIGDSSDNLDAPRRLSQQQKEEAKHKLNAMPGTPHHAETYAHALAEFIPGETDKDRFLSNMHVMGLHDATTISIYKGEKDTEGLRALFEELEFKSMMKFVEEMTT